MNHYDKIIKLRNSLATGKDVNYIDLLFTVLITQIREDNLVKDQLSKLNRLFLKFKRRAKIIQYSSFLQFRFETTDTKHEPCDFLFWVTEPTELKQLINVINVMPRCYTYLVVTDKQKLFNQLDHITNKVYIKRELFGTGKIDKRLFEKVNQSDDLSLTEKSIIINALRIRIPAIDRLSKTFEDLLEKTKPKWVFIGYDITPEGRLLATLCKQKIIPSFAVQHGIIPHDPIHREHLVDKLFVYGNAARSQLVEVGLDASRIEVTGAPYLDEFNPTLPNSADNAIRATVGLSSDQQYILVATSGPGHRTSVAHFERMMDALQQVSEVLEKEHFVVKLHRKDSLVHYEKWRKAIPTNRLTIVPHDAPGLSTNIFDWIRNSKVLITGNSASASEALLMGKPVITIDLMNEYKGVDFIDAGATIHCKTADELQKNLVRVVNDPSTFTIEADRTRRYLTESFYKLDGKASERIINYVTHHYPCAE